MKIHLVVVGPNLAMTVGIEADRLRRAVNAGDMDGVDAATGRLLALTADCVSLDLSEEDWRDFMNALRSSNRGIPSSYLLPGKLFTALLPTAGLNDQVLELPIDSEPAGDACHV